MRAISPNTGAPEVVIAEEQKEYMPISVAVYHYSDGPRGLLTRWQPTPEERAAILAGEDIYVMQLNFNEEPMTPLVARVGPGDWK
jgi:hypothetical protein